MAEHEDEFAPFIPHTDEQTVGPRLTCFCGAEHMTGACIWGNIPNDEPAFVDCEGCGFKYEDGDEWVHHHPDCEGSGRSGGSDG